MDSDTCSCVMSPSEVYGVVYGTHDGAEEVDHGVFGSALTRGSGGGFLRAWRESASERSLRRRTKRRRTDVMLLHKTIIAPQGNTIRET